MTLSVGGILALCVGMSFYSVVHWRKIWPVLGGILLVGLYMKFINMPHAIERWDVWIKSLEIYSTFWGMGFGLGHFKVVYPGLTGEPWEQAHNDILQGMLEMGISFPIILGGFLVSTWIRFRKVLKEAIIPMTMLVIILVNSMVSFPWHIGRTAFLTVTILGILEIKLRSESWLDPKNHLLGIGDS